MPRFLSDLSRFCRILALLACCLAFVRASTHLGPRPEVRPGLQAWYVRRDAATARFLQWVGAALVVKPPADLTVFLMHNPEHVDLVENSMEALQRAEEALGHHHSEVMQSHLAHVLRLAAHMRLARLPSVQHVKALQPTWETVRRYALRKYCRIRIAFPRLQSPRRLSLAQWALGHSVDEAAAIDIFRVRAWTPATSPTQHEHEQEFRQKAEQRLRKIQSTEYPWPVIFTERRRSPQGASPSPSPPPSTSPSTLPQRRPRVAEEAQQGREVRPALQRSQLNSPLSPHQQVRRPLFS